MAWEAHSLSVLTEGRFEMAIGTGRPGIEAELALHVPVVGDAVAPFMTPPDTDQAALRAADSLLILPSDPTAATEEILRRREESGFSYIVVGANPADALAPVVAELTGH
jgi:hypothetical protein